MFGAEPYQMFIAFLNSLTKLLAFNRLLVSEEYNTFG